MRRLAGLAIALALVGLAAPARAGVVDAARGSGHITETEGWRTFAFTVREMPDGSADGQLQVRGPFGDGDIVLHMDLDCLAVSGNTAVATGTVRVIKLPAGAPFNPDGVYAIFAVQDGGEGRGAADRVTTLSPASGPCAGALSAFHDVEAGNIQVTDR
jgi:hypothetical protein